MTNGDKIRSMSDDELVEFLMKQIYPGDMELKDYIFRYHMIRNFILNEYEEVTDADEE